MNKVKQVFRKQSMVAFVTDDGYVYELKLFGARTVESIRKILEAGNSFIPACTFNVWDATGWWDQVKPAPVVQEGIELSLVYSCGHFLFAKQLHTDNCYIVLLGDKVNNKGSVEAAIQRIRDGKYLPKSWVWAKETHGNHWKRVLGML